MTFVYTRRAKSKKSDVEEGFSATFENQEEIRANMEFATGVAKGFQGGKW